MELRIEDYPYAASSSGEAVATVPSDSPVQQTGSSAVNKYAKLGLICLGIVAISVGVGVGVSKMNNDATRLNVAKSTSVESDALPWCTEELTRRKLVVPGTEDIIFHSTTDNLRHHGTERELGKTGEPVSTPVPTTFMPTYDTTSRPTNSVTTVPLMKGTNSPSFAPSSIVSCVIFLLLLLHLMKATSNNTCHIITCYDCRNVRRKVQPLLLPLISAPGVIESSSLNMIGCWEQK